MLISELVRRMREAGAPVEAIEIAIEAIEQARVSPPIQTRSARNHRYYRSHKDAMRERRLNCASERRLKPPEPSLIEASEHRLNSVLTASESVLGHGEASERRLKPSESVLNSDGPRAPAGLVESNLDPKNHPPKKTPPTGGQKKVPSSQASPRKTYLSPDWRLPDDYRAYAIEIGMGAAEIDREAEDFRDYWLREGKPMANWLATWRGWIRRTLDRQGGLPRAGPRQSPHAGPVNGDRYFGRTNPTTIAAINLLEELERHEQSNRDPTRN